MPWVDVASRAIRREVHFGDRVVRCYVDRPPCADALLRRAAMTWPDAEALVDGGRRYRFHDLDRMVEAVAGNLHRLGIVAGDRVALLLGNSAEFVISVLAVARLGAIAVPIGARLQMPEVRHMLTDSEARALIAGVELGGRIPPRSDIPAVDLVVAIGGDIEGSHRYTDLLTPAKAPDLSIGEDDPYAILYTSGTTGAPKGAVISHLGIVCAATQFADCWGLGPGERCVLAVPASHATGIGAVIATMIHVGGCIIVLSSFTASAFLDLAERERMTYAAMVPAMYHLLLRAPDFRRRDLSAWRVGGYGAAPMPPDTIAELAQAVPHLQLVNAYGATETTAPPLLMPLGATSGHPDAVGRVVPTAEVMVVDQAGCELPAGEAGEIWMRGPTVSPGYWRNPTATAQAFVDGWWKSGDIGAFDAEGYLRVLDRKKDMINRGGHKVFSAEVEYVLAEHPAVTECAVVPRPDPVLGERVHAFVVASAPGLSGETLSNWCRGRLADYKVPETYTLQAEPLPRNSTGKVMKVELRRRATEPR